MKQASVLGGSNPLQGWPVGGDTMGLELDASERREVLQWRLACLLDENLCRDVEIDWCEVTCELPVDYVLGILIECKMVCEAVQIADTTIYINFFLVV